MVLASLISMSEASVPPTLTCTNTSAPDALTLTYGLRWEINPAPALSDSDEAITLTSIDPSTIAVARRTRSESVIVVRSVGMVNAYPDRAPRNNASAHRVPGPH